MASDQSAQPEQAVAACGEVLRSGVWVPEQGQGQGQVSEVHLVQGLALPCLAGFELGRGPWSAVDSAPISGEPADRLQCRCSFNIASCGLLPKGKQNASHDYPCRV